MILEFIDSTLAESFSDESRKEDCESAFGIMLELTPLRWHLYISCKTLKIIGRIWLYTWLY